MSQLFELVRDHVEGFDTIAQEWQTADGIKTVNITLVRIPRDGGHDSMLMADSVPA